MTNGETSDTVSNMTTIHADGQSVQQVIEQAIRESIAQDETVRIVASDYDKLCRDLFVECESDSESEGEHLFWGQDLDGNDWSVSVNSPTN